MWRYIASLLVIILFIVRFNDEIAIDVVGDSLDSNEAEYIGLALTDASDDYYVERYRPQYHFSTPEGRLADPNGLIYFEGEYHLFHQKMGTWAHAVSEDLLHWEHLPVALEHDELGQALSGTAVIDWYDTTGLFNGEAGMVAIYTSTSGGEAQGIAYSEDNGRTWERYEGNPVIENPGIHDFRDPKVFWHDDTEMWVMAITTDKSVTFYNSPNLIDWEYQSEFGIDEDGNEQGTHIAVWETPDLFPLLVDEDEDNQKWVLTVSVGDNHVTDGSTNQYFIGDFDGYEFTNDNPPEMELITDFGKDFYAGQSFNELAEAQDRRVWLGWMANWRYPYQSPTEPWMGSMSIPRELSLRTNDEGEIRLFQEPVNEVESIRATEYSVDAFTFDGEHEISEFSGISYEFEMVAEWSDVEEFGLRLRQSDDEETVVGIDVASKKAFLDRTNAGLDTLMDRNGAVHQFGKRFETDFSTEKQQVKIRGLVDESSIELFFDDGEITFTNLIYTKPTNNGIELFSEGGEVDIISLDFYHLHSTWREAPDEGELERVIVSEESIHLEVDESVELTAHAKPDWFSQTEPFMWEVIDPEIIEIEAVDEKNVTITGMEPGYTVVEISDPDGNRSKEITVRVVDEDDSGYIDGWGPSPFNGEVSGNWNIIDSMTITSLLGTGPEWTKIFREEVYSGDFTVSTDIKWLDQGQEGFPKYGINIADEAGTMVSGFFNININELETYAEHSHGELDWEGSGLPSGTDLAEPQTLKIERNGDDFIFYYNDVEMYERTVEMDTDVTVGIINENTEAEFTNFTIDDGTEDDEEEENEGNGLENNGEDENDSENNGSGLNGSNERKVTEKGATVTGSDVNGSEQSKSSDALPNTATSSFNLLLMGLGFVFIGALIWYFVKKRSSLPS